MVIALNSNRKDIDMTKFFSAALLAAGFAVTLLGPAEAAERFSREQLFSRQVKVESRIFERHRETRSNLRDKRREVLRQFDGMRQRTTVRTRR